MHPLTLLAAGLYGQELPPQNGAPLRLVVPWKYGFKGIKSIVKIGFVAEKPPTTWNEAPYRIRVLLERQPGRSASALEPGDRTAHRRGGPPADAAVQRVRRPGRTALCRHGPAGQLLDSRETADMKLDPFTKFVLRLNCLVPVILLCWDAWHGRLGANPVNFAILTTGMLALIFLVLTLAVTPASRLSGWGWLGQFRRTLGLYAFFHASLHFLLFFAFDRARASAAPHRKSSCGPT